MHARKPTRAHMATVAAMMNENLIYDPFLYAAPNPEEFKLTAPIHFQGSLKMRSSDEWHGWTSRWFVLDRTSLVYYTDRMEFEVGRAPLAVMPLDDTFEVRPDCSWRFAVRSSSAEKMFEIVSRPTVSDALRGIRTCATLLKAKDLTEKNRWLDALQTAYCFTRITGSVCGPVAEKNLPMFMQRTARSVSAPMGPVPLYNESHFAEPEERFHPNGTDRAVSDEDFIYFPEIDDDGDEVPPPPPVWTPKTEQHHLQAKPSAETIAESVARILTPPLLSRVHQLALHPERSPPMAWSTLNRDTKPNQSHIPSTQWTTIQPGAPFMKSPKLTLNTRVSAVANSLKDMAIPLPTPVSVSVAAAAPSVSTGRVAMKPASHAVQYSSARPSAATPSNRSLVSPSTRNVTNAPSFFSPQTKLRTPTSSSRPHSLTRARTRSPSTANRTGAPHVLLRARTRSPLTTMRQSPTASGSAASLRHRPPVQRAQSSHHLTSSVEARMAEAHAPSTGAFSFKVTTPQLANRVKRNSLQKTDLLKHLAIESMDI